MVRCRRCGVRSRGRPARAAPRRCRRGNRSSRRCRRRGRRCRRRWRCSATERRRRRCCSTAPSTSCPGVRPLPLTLIQRQYDEQQFGWPTADAPLLQFTFTGARGVAYWNPLQAPQPTALQAWTRIPYCWPLFSPPNDVRAVARRGVAAGVDVEVVAGDRLAVVGRRRPRGGDRRVAGVQAEPAHLTGLARGAGADGVGRRHRDRRR